MSLRYEGKPKLAGLTRQELTQRLTLIRRVIAAAHLQPEGGVLEAREKQTGSAEGARLDELAQWSASSWYLRT